MSLYSWGRRWAVCLAAAMTCCAWPRGAAADGSPGEGRVFRQVQADVTMAGVPVEGDTALTYVRGRGAEGCPEEAEFRVRAASAFDDEDPFVGKGEVAGSRMRVEITRSGGLYRGVYSRVDEQGNALTASVEEHRDCDALVWMLADRMHLSIRRRPVPAPACPACSEPVCPACPPRPPPAAPVCDAACMELIKEDLCKRYGRCMDLTVTVMAGGLMSAGWTLDVGPGAWLGFEVRHDWLSVGAEFRGMFPAAALGYYNSPPYSDLLSFSGVLVPCARWKVLFGCLAVELGQWTFTLPGGISARERSDVLFGAGPRAGVDVPIAAGFSGRAFAEMLLRPYAPRGNIIDLGDPNDAVRVWQLPVVSGFFGIGIAWSH